MSEMEAHATSGGHESKYSFGEHIIALFSSFAIGYLAYGGLWLLIVIYRWIPTLVEGVVEFKSLVDQLGLTMYTPVKEFVVSVAGVDINLFFVVPLAFGILSGLINYGKVLNLEDN